MSDRERIKRESMQRTAFDLRQQAARAGNQVTQTEAEARVKVANTVSENKRNNK